MLIEILGSSGAGKTTIKRMLLDRLRDYGLQARDAEISANGTSCSKFKIILVELLRHPWILPMACRLGSQKYGRHGVIHWLKCLVRNVYTGRIAQSQGGVFLIDQDVISSLSRTPEVPRSLIKRIPLPDLVIEIRADAAVMQKRRIMREQLPSHLTCGQQQLINGRHVAALLSDSHPSELPALMKQWNERFCSPMLAPEELEQVIQEGLGMAKLSENGDKSDPRGVLWWALKNGKRTILSDEDALLIRQELQQRGLQWWTVDNGREDNLSDIVDSLAERISREIQHPSRFRRNGEKVLS